MVFSPVIDVTALRSKNYRFLRYYINSLSVILKLYLAPEITLKLCILFCIYSVTTVSDYFNPVREL
jgi:hypothetical protein